MIGAEALCCAPSGFRFAEFEIGERDCEGVNTALRAAGERGDGRRIEAAAKKYADRHIGDQMAGDCLLEQRAHSGCRRGRGVVGRDPACLRVRVRV